MSETPIAVIVRLRRELRQANPNPTTTWKELLWQIFEDLELYGISYLWTPLNDLGKPTDVFRLPVKDVCLVMNGKRTIYLQVADHGLKGRYTTIPMSEVIVSKSNTTQTPVQS